MGIPGWVLRGNPSVGFYAGSRCASVRLAGPLASQPEWPPASRRAQAVRTCPICRTTTYLVTPSSVWPSSPEAKDAIVGGYKAKVGAIPCKYYNFGEGEPTRAGRPEEGGAGGQQPVAQAGAAGTACH